jgi:hypothetical protein
MDTDTPPEAVPTGADSESSEETDLQNLSVILRSNVFPGSSYTSNEWCSVVKNVYPDHEISPSKEVGIYMKPKKDFRRKV